MRFFTTERLGPKQSLTPEGFLLCEDVPLSRTGVQVYGPGEVPITPAADGTIRVVREPEQVFRPETLASGNGKPVTIDHPPVDVTPDNWRELAMGYLISPRRGPGAFDDLTLGDLMITCPDTIKRVRARELNEISLGYDADYEEIAPGQGRQTNILINHCALLEPGGSRCGPRCSIGDHQPDCLRATRDSTGALLVGETERPEYRLYDALVAHAYRTTDPPPAPRRPRLVHVHLYR